MVTWYEGQTAEQDESDHRLPRRRGLMPVPLDDVAEVDQRRQREGRGLEED